MSLPFTSHSSHSTKTSVIKKCYISCPHETAPPYHLKWIWLPCPSFSQEWPSSFLPNLTYSSCGDFIDTLTVFRTRGLKFSTTSYFDRVLCVLVIAIKIRVIYVTRPVNLFAKSALPHHCPVNFIHCSRSLKILEVFCATSMRGTWYMTSTMIRKYSPIFSRLRLR